jgi:hypothetical protein
LLFRIACHDSHVDMKTKNCNMLPKMRSRQGSTDNVFSSRLGNDRQDLSKIPTKDHDFRIEDFPGCLCIPSRASGHPPSVHSSGRPCGSTSWKFRGCRLHAIPLLSLTLQFSTHQEWEGNKPGMK